MWLCTQHGFYSIVRKAGDEYHIRARKREDLENLSDLIAQRYPRASQAHAWKIHRSVPADYRWRMVVTARALGYVFAALESSIDYSNFKSRIHDRVDQREKSQAYGSLWADLYRLQE